MPSITIREADNTIYGLSTVSSDNIVFIPGSATTGPSDRAILLGSVNELINVFGPSSPEGSDSVVGSAWDYAYGILYSGLPVLFKRITDLTSGTSKTALTETAEVDIMDGYTNNNTPLENAVKVATIKAKYSGTFGNKLTVSIEVLPTSYYLKVYKSGSLLENIKLLTISGTEDAETIRTKLIESIESLDCETIDIELMENAKASFALTSVEHLALSGGKDADESEVIKQVPLEFAELSDKYVTDVKFLTGGGYYDADKADTLITNAMIDLAESRTDCVAFPDVPIGLPREDVTSYFTRSSSYAAVYAPWIYMQLPDRTYKWMPPSYVFLYTLGKSLSAGGSLWNPPAGVTRATVAEAVKSEYEIGSSILEKWQETNPQSINPIMSLRQYGYVIYGQRTLYSNVDGNKLNISSLQELGVRIVINEIKRTAFNIALALTFEQNNVRTWNEFRGRLDPILSQMKTDRGIVDYQIIMDDTVTSTKDVDTNKIRGIIKVSVSRAAEDFDISFDLMPSAVLFSDEGSEFTI